MRQIFKLFFSCFGIAVALSGCSDDKGTNIQPKRFEPIPVSRSEEVIVDADNYFAYKLFDAIDEHAGKHTNFVVSPLSVSITLAMAANGASGETLDEMLDVLGFENKDIVALNTFYKKMLDRLPELDNTTTVSIANALWINKKFSSTTSTLFSDNMRDYFNSPITFIDNITSEATRQLINKWYSDNTHGILSGPSVGNFEKQTAAVFTNALYFKGWWTSTFDKSKTQQRDFTNYDGSKSKVMMMDTESYMMGYADYEYRAVTLPYGNSAYSMIIILPDDGVSLDSCMEDINPDDISRLAKDCYMFDGSNIHLRLPKFEINYESNMIPALQELGLTKMFKEGEAEFSMMCGPDMFISRITQGVSIIVDEGGTKAISYTETKGDGLTAPGPLPAYSDFFVDRPFAFIIAEKSTGLPLFMGRINKF